MDKKDEALVKFIETVKSTSEDEFVEKYIEELDQGDEAHGEEKD